MYWIYILWSVYRKKTTFNIISSSLYSIVKLLATQYCHLLLDAGVEFTYFYSKCFINKDNSVFHLKLCVT